GHGAVASADVDRCGQRVDVAREAARPATPGLEPDPAADRLPALLAREAADRRVRIRREELAERARIRLGASLPDVGAADDRVAGLPPPGRRGERVPGLPRFARHRCPREARLEDDTA